MPAAPPPGGSLVPPVRACAQFRLSATKLLPALAPPTPFDALTATPRRPPLAGALIASVRRPATARGRGLAPADASGLAGVCYSLAREAGLSRISLFLHL
jgi:hypothetical protein